MARPTVQLICNAHLDPVWQWRWEEGCGEALSTFGTAIRMLEAHPGLIFNHNEAILYRWVMQYDPALFRAIQKFVRAGRWCISGGWYLQPDVNLPLMESIIRHITEGRQFFEKYFDAHPIVAYNFDSFGHGGGLPQILRQADYKMYIHMRPQEPELHLPSDLYRWQGVDGSEILTYRIAVGLYHTERDNIEQRLSEGTALALHLNRDVPVFWGIGNHGGGATQEDLEKIDAFIRTEKRVRVVHSTPEKLFAALRPHGRSSPVVKGDIQRVMTGCYTSLSRLKRRALATSSALIQTEALATTAWWQEGSQYPGEQLRQAWQQTLFNDFHDILPGSCSEPAEQDALDLYGAAGVTIGAVRMGAVAAMNSGKQMRLYIPVTVLNTNTALSRVPVGVECMLDLRPKWTGTWHLQLKTLDGREVPCQEEQPESLLPFNGWRRKLSFMADLPQLGAARYVIEIHEGLATPSPATPLVRHVADPATGLLRSLDAGEGRECLAGPLMLPLVVEDTGDAWGADCWRYRNVVGTFAPAGKTPVVLHDGPIRRTTETSLSHGASTIVIQTTVYPDWPVIEYNCRVHWHEEHKRLKLSFPTVFRSSSVLCEIPGGIIERPADGEEHVHGRWCMAAGLVNGKETATRHRELRSAWSGCDRGRDPSLGPPERSILSREGTPHPGSSGTKVHGSGSARVPYPGHGRGHCGGARGAARPRRLAVCSAGGVRPSAHWHTCPFQNEEEHRSSDNGNAEPLIACDPGHGTQADGGWKSPACTPSGDHGHSSTGDARSEAPLPHDPPEVQPAGDQDSPYCTERHVHSSTSDQGTLT